MKFIRHLSIKYKLTLLVLMISMVSIVIGFSIIIINDIIRLREDLVNKTQLDASVVGEYCVGPLEFDDKDGLKDLLGKLRSIPTIENAWVYIENGEHYGTYDRVSTTLVPPPPPGDDDLHEFRGDYLHVARPISHDDKKLGTIYFRASTSQLRERTNIRIFWLVILMAGSILLSYVLALRFQRIISKPILELAEVTGKISHDVDYSIRVQREDKDEIGTLYNGFNNMLEKIQLWEKKRDEAEAEQRRLLMELESKNKELEQVVYVTSHDLRSPLVNIQGFGQELSYSIKEVDSLLAGLDADTKGIKDEISVIIREDVLESLKFIESSTTKMDGLLSGLLRLSRVGRMTTGFENVDMNNLMKEVSNAFEFHFKEAGASLEVQPLPACYGSELEINQVFSNLVGNAIKYRDPGRTLLVKISEKKSDDSGSVVYCVEDNGVGIPEEYQSKIFQIFHRLKPDDSEGEGLGLAIAHKIVHRHKGTVKVESKPGKGSKFFITLPRAS
ncbi:MAG: HAMP domain-containing protein [bacterium]|nr:HAMP domain-containing protein [bacterium]